MHMQASFKQEKDLIGKGGFQVAIVSNNNALALEVGHRVFKGFLDRCRYLGLGHISWS